MTVAIDYVLRCVKVMTTPNLAEPDLIAQAEGLVYLVYLDLYPLQDFCSPMKSRRKVT